MVGLRFPPKKITDPSSAKINYAFDRTGRLTGVTGSGTLYSSVSTYASSISYRAWGALKSMDYGDSTSETLEYNNRLQPTSYSVTGVKVYNTTTAQPEGGDFTYYNDGMLKFASDDRSDASMYGMHDRAFVYDHAARMRHAYSSAQAQDYRDGTSHTYYSGQPFEHDFSYDAFNNMTDREGYIWDEFDDGTETYNNSQNRNDAWSYDADGRMLSANDPAPDNLTWSPYTMSFNAAGQQSFSTQTTSRQSPLNPSITWTTIYTRTNSFDGNGAMVKLAESSQQNSGSPTTSATYYLRSSVTGNVLAEYDNIGLKRKSNIYIGNQMVAQQLTDGTTTSMLWQHINPVTGDGVNTLTNGQSLELTRVDPYGMNMGDASPFSSPDPGFGEVAGEGMNQSAMNNVYGDYFGGDGHPMCAVNGVLGGCRAAEVLEHLGAAATDEYVDSQGMVHQRSIDEIAPGVYGHWEDSDVPDRPPTTGPDGNPVYYVTTAQLFVVDGYLSPRAGTTDVHPPAPDPPGYKPPKKPHCSITVKGDGYQSTASPRFTSEQTKLGKTSFAHGNINELQVEISGHVTNYPVSKLILGQMAASSGIGFDIDDNSNPEYTIKTFDSPWHDDSPESSSEYRRQNGTFGFIDAPGLFTHTGSYQGRYTSYAADANGKILCSVNWHVRFRVYGGNFLESDFGIDP